MQVTSLLGGDKPEKEVVRINLPPKPRGGPLIKLPQLPLGSPASKNVEPKVEEKVPGFYKKGDGEMKPELFIEGFNLSDRLVWPRVDYNAKLEEIRVLIKELGGEEGSSALGAEKQSLEALLKSRDYINRQLPLAEKYNEVSPEFISIPKCYEFVYGTSIFSTHRDEISLPVFSIFPAFSKSPDKVGEKAKIANAFLIEFYFGECWGQKPIFKNIEDIFLKKATTNENNWITPVNGDRKSDFPELIVKNYLKSFRFNIERHNWYVENAFKKLDKETKKKYHRRAVYHRQPNGASSTVFWTNFNGILPKATREALIEAREVFQEDEIYLAKVNSTWNKPSDTNEAMLLGLRDDKMYVIDYFHSVPLKEIDYSGRKQVR